MEKTVRPFGSDMGLIHEFVVTGRKAGADRAFYSKLAHNERLFERVVSLVARNGYGTTPKRALEIMGSNNFFGIEEGIKYFGVDPINRRINILSEIPFSEETLEESKDTHILVLVFPLSILEIRNRIKPELFWSPDRRDWYDGETFAEECKEVSWQLVRKTPVDESTLKNWQNQQALIGENDEVPSAQVIVYTMIGHYLATGERLFENVYVRTASVDCDGDHICFGCFDLEGLDIYCCGDNKYDSLVGVSSARKF